MAIEHDAISDGERHEPKGIASANANQIYIADGLGSGTWSNNVHSTHGNMIIENNATATSVTAATDATLNTDSDYVKVTAGWSLEHGDDVTLNTDELVVGTAGDYFITFWAAVKVPSTNNFVGVKYAINDTTPYSTSKIKAQSQSTNDYLNLAASGFAISLSANDTLSIYIAASKTDNLVVEEAGVVAMLVHPGA